MQMCDVPAQTMVLPPWNAWCSVIFPPTLTRLSSGCRENLNSYMNITVPNKVQFTYRQHHFNRATLYWTDKRTQTRGTRAYRLFKSSLRQNTVTDIVLPMAAAIIEVRRRSIFDSAWPQQQYIYHLQRS